MVDYFINTMYASILVTNQQYWCKCWHCYRGSRRAPNYWHILAIIGTFTVSQIWESLHAFSFATKCKQISQRMEVFKVRASLTLLKSLAIVKYYLVTFMKDDISYVLSFSVFLIGGQTNVYIMYTLWYHNYISYITDSVCLERGFNKRRRDKL